MTKVIIVVVVRMKKALSAGENIFESRVEERIGVIITKKGNKAANPVGNTIP